MKDESLTQYLDAIQRELNYIDNLWNDLNRRPVILGRNLDHITNLVANMKQELRHNKSEPNPCKDCKEFEPVEEGSNFCKNCLNCCPTQEA
ncbi:MAG: hypothetical protein KAS32_13775 [Candidatus Peribacteraceae bacterium]|nr:hypothetical protein [Candidatus Peribacteraceae bacterium]